MDDKLTQLNWFPRVATMSVSGAEAVLQQNHVVESGTRLDTANDWTHFLVAKRADGELLSANFTV